MSGLAEKLACNKPKRTPDHSTKSHVVKGCENGKERLVRFGQQGVKGEGNSPKTEKGKKRRKAFRARHNCSEPGSKLAARYWACKEKW